MADYNVNKYSYNGNNYLLEDNRITLGSSTETFLRNDGTFTIPSVPEAYLTWGGKNFSANYAPIDAAMIDPLGANRFAFLKAAGLTIEYSRDGGSTWTDYGATDVQKVGLFANGYNFYLGKASAVADNNVNNQLRVTIDTGAASIYSVINKIAIYMSTNGNTVQVKLEKALQSTPTTYNTHLDWTGISGWGGWNILNITEITTYGNAAGSQYGRLRFTFRQTAINTSYGSANISRILGFGGMGWKTPSNMAKEGHLYSYDASQNATFPAKVTATQFNGLATKATADGDGNTIKTTYLKLAGGTMTGVLTALGSQYTDSYSGALNMNNSNIYGVNSIYTADASDNAQEGIHFYRSATTVDTIYANSGNLYFVPNRTLGTNGTAYTVYHTGNKPTYSDVGAAASSHNHNIENLTNFSARVYDATISRTANTVLAAPNGSAGTASFRALVVADIPNLDAGKITSGTLPIARGGTGLTASPSMLTNLATTTAANVFAASPRPGVTGTLPVANGGTGITTSTYVNAVVVGNASTATNALRTIRTASGAFYATAQDGAPAFGTLPAAQGGTGNTSLQATRNAMGLGNTTGALPIANGGTGLTASPSMLTNLGSTSAANILAASPRPGVTGTLPVANGGTGATTFTSGAALIGAGTGAVTTRTITNNTATSTNLAANTNLITQNTLRYHTNRLTSAATADTNYTTYMFRGQTLNSAATNAAQNGQIAWQYA